MNITIRINLDNDIFQPDPTPELSHLLRRLADRLLQAGVEEGQAGNIVETNGNVCGHYLVDRS